MSMFKSRFCPSPTGAMHVGNLRTALFSYLLAKSHEAQTKAPSTFLLRIEDTDFARSEDVFTQKLMDDLRWLNLDWQEGPDCEGSNGPYFQAQRNHIYEEYYQKLINDKKAYWCFCTPFELDLHRKAQLSSGQPPRYAGTCRHLTPEQIQAKQNQGLKPALRFHLSDNELIQFEDFVLGLKTFKSEDIGDFIICKNDGSSSFMFCNAVDDALMGVTHVLRGEDHLTNTPRQLIILKALGLRLPHYGHLPLIMGFDGKPLSKRNGSESVENLRNQGYLQLGIINYLARLGHHFEQEKFLNLNELSAHFSPKHIGRSPARFDKTQLNYWQKEAVMQLDDVSMKAWLLPHLNNPHSDEQLTPLIETIKQNIVLPMDAQFWAKQFLTDEYEWQEDALNALQEAGPDFLNALHEALKKDGNDYQKVQDTLKQLTDRKGKALFMPLRAALTGACHGPELVKIFALMGLDRLKGRVQAALNLIKDKALAQG